MQSVLNLAAVVGGVASVARTGQAHLLTIYDSISEKKHVLDLKVASREFEAAAEAADVPVQYRGKDGGAAVCDNIIARGKLLSLTIIAGAGASGGSFAGAVHIKGLLESAASNGFYLKYEDLLSDPLENLVITGLKAEETASGNKGGHFMISLSLKQVLPFTLESPFPPKTTSIRSVTQDAALGLSTAAASFNKITSPQTRAVARGAKEGVVAESKGSQLQFYEISPSFNFGNYYGFATNFYLDKLFLGFVFKYIDAQNRYELSIYSDNALVYTGIARFFEPIPGLFGYDLSAPISLRPQGGFVFLPAVSAHPKAQANITKEDFESLNFRLFFISY